MKKLPINKDKYPTETMLKDPVVRLAVIRESHLWFFLFYLAHYVKYAMAAFHREIFTITESLDISCAVIVAFRGSGKSTLITLSYALWAIMGREQRKFILLVGRTQEQSRQMLRNSRTELENNKLLRHDLGPFREEEDEWRNTSLVIQNFGARITAVSIDQSIRGIRHKEHRPDLIICDDIEDLESVQTRDSRKKTHSWITNELMPIGDIGTRLFFIGNYLHDDSFTQRMRGRIEAKEYKNAVYKAYPLVDDEGNCLWSAKYPDEDAILAEHARVGDEGAWHREYLLRILSGTERVIHPEWIRFYDTLPEEDYDVKTGTRIRLLHTAIGIDLAISQDDSADCTAMVALRLYYVRGEYHMYILPNPVNARLSTMETLNCAMQLADCSKTKEHEVIIYVEDVGYQGSLADHLKNRGYDAEGVKVRGQDKRGRLALAAHHVQGGRVFFPREGAEELIDQLVNFGAEKYDDMADAFSLLILRSAEEKLKGLSIAWIDNDGGMRGWSRIQGDYYIP